MRQGDGSRNSEASADAGCPDPEFQAAAQGLDEIAKPSRRKSDGSHALATTPETSLRERGLAAGGEAFAQGLAAYQAGDVYHVAYARAVQHGLLPGSAPYRAFVQGFFQAIRQAGSLTPVSNDN